jgi:hypothetical protein
MMGAMAKNDGSDGVDGAAAVAGTAEADRVVEAGVEAGVVAGTEVGTGAGTEVEETAAVTAVAVAPAVSTVATETAAEAAGTEAEATGAGTTVAAPTATTGAAAPGASAVPAAAAATGSRGRGSARLRTTVRDMLLSMAVIVLPILLVIWLMPSNTPKTPVNVISASEYQSMLTAARSDLPFTALSPTGLPGSWQLTSDDYQPAGDAAADWHLGYQTPSGKYAEFEQITETPAQFLNEQSSDATQTATVTVPDAASGSTSASGSASAPGQWQEYTGTTPGGLKTLLFRQDGKASLEVVAGSAPLTELETLAASLRS